MSHVMHQEVHVTTDYPHTAYTLGGFLRGPSTTSVTIQAQFDDDEAAFAFENAVRDLLEKA